MKPSDVFGIILRVFGLSMTIYSFWSLLTTLSLLGVEGFDTPTVWFFISEIGGLLLGIYLLRGAPHVVHFSYPNERSS
jgi:hypothetical protein